jgi:anti-sigma regulatory factor (Ser/Thr protein kinase)
MIAVRATSTLESLVTAVIAGELTSTLTRIEFICGKAKSASDARKAIRAALKEFLDPEKDKELIYDMDLAVGEASTNALQHCITIRPPYVEYGVHEEAFVMVIVNSCLIDRPITPRPNDVLDEHHRGWVLVKAVLHPYIVKGRVEKFRKLPDPDPDGRREGIAKVAFRVHPA